MLIDSEQIWWTWWEHPSYLRFAKSNHLKSFFEWIKSFFWWYRWVWENYFESFQLGLYDVASLAFRPELISKWRLIWEWVWCKYRNGRANFQKMFWASWEFDQRTSLIQRQKSFWIRSSNSIHCKKRRDFVWSLAIRIIGTHFL